MDPKSRKSKNIPIQVFIFFILIHIFRSKVSLISGGAPLGRAIDIDLGALRTDAAAAAFQVFFFLIRE